MMCIEKERKSKALQIATTPKRKRSAAKTVSVGKPLDEGSQ
jgi:hypothetical protein